MPENETNRRTVVFGVDASEHSERALDWFIENMWDKADHVMFIHAQEYPNIATHPYGSYVSLEEWQRMVAKSDREVSELMEAYGNKCKKHEVTFTFYKKEHGNPGEVICKLAEDVDAQLIVTGCRGMSTLRRTLLGSCSDYCVHHAHVPVAVVPSPKHISLKL